MDEELLNKWLKALRSGEYTQARNALSQTYPDGTSSYCCLGVLCDISGLGEWIDDGCNDPDMVYKVKNRLYEGEYIPSELGLDHSLCTTLARKNDTGADFEEIADYIEDVACE